MCACARYFYSSINKRSFVSSLSVVRFLYTKSNLGIWYMNLSSSHSIRFFLLLFFFLFLLFFPAIRSIVLILTINCPLFHCERISSFSWHTQIQFAFYWLSVSIENCTSWRYFKHAKGYLNYGNIILIYLIIIEDHIAKTTKNKLDSNSRQFVGYRRSLIE